MDNNIKIFKEGYEACYQIAQKLKELNKEGANVAISGGSSPILLFKIMKDEFKYNDFNNIKFFWVDERFVEKESYESNFGNFSKILIENNIISKNNVFPMYKELTIDETIDKVSKEILSIVKIKNEKPSFDLIILGLGEDGHTASLFPNNLQALDSKEILIKTNHPQSNQERITLTKDVINNAKEIIFLSLGEKKAIMVKYVLIDKNKSLPASYIKNDNSVYWYLDKHSATLI